MKVVLLAGGLGTRLNEETHVKPKPMVEIGGKPILWHIMKIYAHHGFTEFVICLGYKSHYGLVIIFFTIVTSHLILQIIQLLTTKQLMRNGLSHL